jgi:hypothetical protein
MWEGGAEVGPIDRAVSGGFGGIEVFTAPTVEFHGFLVGNVGEAYRKKGLLLTEDAWAPPKIGSFIFLKLW